MSIKFVEAVGYIFFFESSLIVTIFIIFIKYNKKKTESILEMLNRSKIKIYNYKGLFENIYLIFSYIGHNVILFLLIINFIGVFILIFFGLDLYIGVNESLMFHEKLLFKFLKNN